MSRFLGGYWRRELLKPTPIALYAIMLVLLVLALSPDPFIVAVAADIMFWMGLAAALNIIMGFAGYVSFGHVVFMGLGGYTMALLMEYWLPGLADQNQLLVAALGVIAGAAFAAAVAASVGSIVLRLRGAFFAIATIGLDLTAMYLFYELPTREGGGEIYFSHIPSLQTAALYTWIVLAASLAAMLVVKKSRLGMGLEAIREDEDAAESLGVPTARYKTIAFTLSAALAGAMGAVYAWRTLSVTPFDAFNLIYSVKMIVILVVGGMGTLLGPVAGTLIYYLIYLFLTTNPQLSPLADMVMGVLAIAIVMFAPRGLIGYLRLSKLVVAGRPVYKLLE